LFAVSLGNEWAVSTLLEWAVNPNKSYDRYGNTALHLACGFEASSGINALGMVRLLLRAKASPLIQNGSTHETPLHVAIKTKNLDIVKAIIEHSPSVLQTLHNTSEIHITSPPSNDSKPTTTTTSTTTTLSYHPLPPLHLAASMNSVPMLRLLLSHGAPVNALSYTSNPTLDPTTALHLSCMIPANDGMEAIKLLLEHGGADVNTMDSKKRTALFVAVTKNRYMYAEILLKHGARPDVSHSVSFTSSSASLKSPLLKACTKGYVEMVRLLLDHGAKVGPVMGLWKVLAMKNGVEGGVIAEIGNLLKRKR
jgi:ankyrin repeat protein